MKSVKDTISACRHCRFYQSEGRRGGSCHQLGVPVQGGWKSCSLAAQPFASRWDSWTEIVSQQLTSADPQSAEIAIPKVALAEIEPVATAVMIEEIFLSVE